MARTPFHCPKDALLLTMFADLDRLAADYAAKRFNGVLLVGDPGLIKTRTFQQACGANTRRGGGSRATYFRQVKKLPSRTRLVPRPPQGCKRPGTRGKSQTIIQ